MFLIWFFIGLGITGTQLKKINKLYSNANKVKDTFEQYYKLVDKIENANFEAALLQEKQQLVISDKEKASQILKQFASILNAFDQRVAWLHKFLFDRWKNSVHFIAKAIKALFERLQGLDIEIVGRLIEEE